MWRANNLNKLLREEQKKGRNPKVQRTPAFMLNPKRHPKIQVLLHRSPMGATLSSSALISTARVGGSFGRIIRRNSRQSYPSIAAPTSNYPRSRMP